MSLPFALGSTLDTIPPLQIPYTGSLHPVRTISSELPLRIGITWAVRVISVDTAVAHLAASLRKPTWVLIPYAPGRWLNDRQDSPWYPSVRLFRQKSPGDWISAIREVAKELSMLIDQRSFTINAQRPAFMPAAVCSSEGYQVNFKATRLISADQCELASPSISQMGNNVPLRLKNQSPA
jgi:hypothetical protein